MVAPFQLVVLSGGWPSGPITIASLGLLLLGAFFPSSLHQYFKPKGGTNPWNTLSNIKSTIFLEDVGFVLSGSARFIKHAFGLVGTVGPVIALVSLPLKGTPPKAHQQHRLAAQSLLRRLKLWPVFFLDSDNGGATDGCHLFGFGLGLGLDVLPSVTGGLPLILCHFLDCRTAGHMPPSSLVTQMLLPVLDNPLRRVLWHLDMLRGEGLFPCRLPRSRVYCPSHFFPWKWVTRPLSLAETLCLSSEVQNKMIIMGHQISSCHVPVVRSFFIL
jgi:hypothetical protein